MSSHCGSVCVVLIVTMTEAEAVVLNALQVRRKLSNLSVSIKRMSTKLQRTVADTLHEFQDLDLLEVEKLELLTLKTEYKNNSSQLCGMEEDELLKEADEEAYLATDADLTTALMNCGLLISWKRVQSATRMLDTAVTSLNNLWMKDPGAQYSSLVADMARDSKTLHFMVETSRIDTRDPLRDHAKEVCARADGLRIKLGSPPTPDDKTVFKKLNPGYKRAPLHVPTFSGDLKEWHTFWTSFKLAIHEAVDLEPAIKLSYLKESMKDKTLQRTLTRYADGPDAYNQAVKELQARFDKPKHMHRLYLKSVTTLAPVKATQTDLTAFADTVQEALDGLKRLKQVDLESVLTSLCSECLPEKVRLAWEDSTEACRTVAPVTELLEFVRRKADNPLYMDRSRGSSHQEKGGYLEKRPAGRTRGSAHVAVSASPSAPPPQQSTGQQHSGSGNKSSSHRNRGSPQQGSRYTCPLCQDQHYCYACSNFRRMNVHQRKEYVSNNSLCSLCLRPNHSPEECRGNFSCRVCKGTHNTLLHIDSGSGAASGNVSGTANVVATTTGSLSSNKLLMTCQVLATGPTGKAMPIRGLLDSGADISAVTTNIPSLGQLA